MVGVEAVHLDEQLVQRVLALVVPAHDAGHAARLAERVELVDEDDARRLGLAPAANRSRTRAAPMPTNSSTNSEPLIEKNGTFGLAGDGFGEQRLARPGRSDQQHALGQLAAERPELLGLARNWTISCSSSFASSAPATSANVTPVSFSA